MGLPKITMGMIHSWGPCTDPGQYAPIDWSGTALDILTNVVDIPPSYKLWAVLRLDCIPEEVLRRFACWCAAENLFSQPNPHPDSFRAIEAKLGFLTGAVSKLELAEACSAARLAWAAEAARRAATRAASAVEAKWAIEWAATRAAAESAARLTVEQKQVEKLVSMLEGRSSFSLSDLRNMG